LRSKIINYKDLKSFIKKIKNIKEIILKVFFENILYLFYKKKIFDLNLVEKKNVLVFVAHHDDEVIYCGGTLCKLAKNKNRIHIIVLTDAKFQNTELGKENYIKRRESFYQVNKYLNSTYTECNIENYKNLDHIVISDILKAVINKVNLIKINPDLIITHGIKGEYGHAQHKLTHIIANKIFKNYPIYYFNNGLTVDKIWVNISEKEKNIIFYYYENWDKSEFHAVKLLSDNWNIKNLEIFEMY